MTTIKSQSSQSYLSLSQGSFQTTLRTQNGLDSRSIQASAERSVSSRMSSITQQTIELNDSPERTHEESKEKITQTNSQNGQGSIIGQSDNSYISIDSSLHSISQKDNQTNIKKQCLQKNDNRDIGAHLRLPQIYQKPQRQRIGQKNKANLKSVSKVLQESEDDELLNLTMSAEIITRNISKIALKLGSAAVIHSKDGLPIGKRTRLQKKIEMKNKLQKQKWRKQDQKLPVKKRNRRVNRSKSKNIQESRGKKRSRKSSLNLSNQCLSISSKSLFSNISKSQKNSKSRQKMQSNDQRTPQRQSKITPNKQKTPQFNDQTNSENNSVFPSSKEKDKRSRSTSVQKIRELQRDSRDCLEYLLDFKGGSIQVFSSEQLARLWPRKYGAYLLSKRIQI